MYGVIVTQKNHWRQVNITRLFYYIGRNEKQWNSKHLAGTALVIKMQHETLFYSPGASRDKIFNIRHNSPHCTRMKAELKIKTYVPKKIIACYKLWDANKIIQVWTS